MVPILSVIASELQASLSSKPQIERVPESGTVMSNADQVAAYDDAYVWNGPTTPLLVYNLSKISKLIRPGDLVVDLACGPGHLLLELAQLFPDTRFLGVDLAKEMLDLLAAKAKMKNLKNVETLCEDISKLSSMPNKSVDLFISIQALHHLPNLDVLESTFRRVNQLLKSDGCLYFFDFALLRSQRSRQLIVADAAKEISAITAQDYLDSLNAAFPANRVQSIAGKFLPRPFSFKKSLFIDLFFLIEKSRNSAQKHETPEHLISELKSRMRLDRKLELMSLKYLARTRVFD